jgi:hypothetical protein
VRLAFYTCLALAILCFWAWAAFVVLYFIHLPDPTFGEAALVCFGGSIAFTLVAVGIARYEVARS